MPRRAGVRVSRLAAGGSCRINTTGTVGNQTDTDGTTDASGTTQFDEHYLDPLDHGIARHGPGEIRGGDTAHNAAVAWAVLAGERGAPRDVVTLNAACALVAAGAASDVDEGLLAARESLDTGAASRVLDQLVRLSAS